MKHREMDDLFYSEPKMQPYLMSNKFSVSQARMIYSLRVRMTDFQENFRGPKGPSPCPLCLVHLDSQAMALQCPKLRKHIKVTGNFEKFLMIIFKWI